MFKQTRIKITFLAGILIAACFVGLATNKVAYADEEASLQVSPYGLGKTTNVTVGLGTYISKNFKFNQAETYRFAMNDIIALREDAYNSSDIYIHGMRLWRYCDYNHISKAEYKNVKWSNALERIAIQRAAESAVSTFGSKRPNGTAASTAKYQGISADAEVQDWFNSTTGTYDVSAMMERIQLEKTEYQKKCRGEKTNVDCSRYLALIDPDYTCIGASVTDGIDKKKVGVIEMGKTLKGISGTASLGLNGSYPIEIALNSKSADVNPYDTGDSDDSDDSDDNNNDNNDDNNNGNETTYKVTKFCMNATKCYRMNIGTTYKFTATVRKDGKKVTAENWYSSDSSVISITSSGEAKALKAGTATIYVFGKDGAKVQTITVPENTEMFRLYNPYTGEHFYTGDAYERDQVKSAGWRFEGIGWIGLRTGNKPLYRCYNPNSGEHLYTISEEEKKKVVQAGWIYEGVACKTAGSGSGTPVYRLYNPYVPGNNPGSHHYTTSKQEYESLITKGWKGEGQAWTGVWYSV